MRNVIKAARRRAQVAHFGQTYGNEDYFKHHVSGVVGIALQQHQGGVDKEHLQAVAWLHDVVEDTPVTLADLFNEGFPFEVVHAVEKLTKFEGYSAHDYLCAIQSDPLARAVKIADATFNLNSSLREGNARRVVKYADYIKALA